MEALLHLGALVLILWEQQLRHPKRSRYHLLDPGVRKKLGMQSTATFRQWRTRLPAFANGSVASIAEQKVQRKTVKSGKALLLDALVTAQ